MSINDSKCVEVKSCSPVAVIIPYKDQHEYTVKCVRSIFTSLKNPSLAKIYLVDNNSECDETSYSINLLTQEFAGQVICLSYPHAFNFSAINNFAVCSIEEDYIFFVNNDIEVITPRLFEAGIAALDNKEIGIVSFELLYADGSIQHSGVRLNIRNNPYHELLNNEATKDVPEKQLHETFACTGALLGIKKPIFELVGGFDEDFPTSYNDIDLCLKVRNKGLKIVVNRTHKAFHFESKTRGLDYIYGNKNTEKKERLLNDRARLHNKYPKIFRNALIDPISCDSNPLAVKTSECSLSSEIIHTDFHKIFFVSSTRQSNIGLDPSVIYRCINPAKKIHQNYKYSHCNVVSLSRLIDSYKSISCPNNYFDDSILGQLFLSNVVIFHRPQFSIELAQIIEKLKDKGCKIFADYDDYVFDVSTYKNTSAGEKLVKNSEDMSLLHSISLNYAALELFDEFIVSTKVLKLNLAKVLTTASRRDYKIHVIQNTPSSYWFSYADILFDQAYKDKKRSVNTSILGYFGGTASHSGDFQLIYQWISDFLRRECNLKFIYCSVAFEQLFSELHKDQILKFAPVTFNKLPAVYNMSWLSLAPLSASPFNQSKSGLKYFESAMFGLPVCATHIPDIQDRFKGMPLLYTLDTPHSIKIALENSQLLFCEFNKYLEAWDFVLTNLKKENISINRNLFEVLNI